MRHQLIAGLALSILSGAVLGGCGSDEGKRGLQPSDETAVPSSNAEDAMTEEERAKQTMRDLPEGE